MGTTTASRPEGCDGPLTPKGVVRQECLACGKCDAVAKLIAAMQTQAPALSHGVRTSVQSVAHAA